jgi:hypothetical protein
LHIKPDRWPEEEPPGAGVVEPALEDLCLDEGEGPAEAGPVLFGVRFSCLSSPSCLEELARLVWLLDMSVLYPDWLYTCPLSACACAGASIANDLVSKPMCTSSSIAPRLDEAFSDGGAGPGEPGESGGGSGNGFSRLLCRLRFRALWVNGGGLLPSKGGEGEEAMLGGVAVRKPRREGDLRI